MNNRPTHTHGSPTVDGSTDQFSHSRAIDEMDQLPKPDFEWRPIPSRLSEQEALSLATPQVVLYANWSDESLQALQAFERARTGLSLLIDPDAFHPRAVWGNNVFEGLYEIETLLMALQAMKAQMIASIERSDVTDPRPHDPVLARWMTTITDRQLAAAQNVMKRLQASHHHKERR